MSISGMHVTPLYAAKWLVDGNTIFNKKTEVVRMSKVHVLQANYMLTIRGTQLLQGTPIFEHTTRRIS